MSSPIIGIDLGTTNSVVAVADGASVRVIDGPWGNKTTASVVSFHPSGSVLVGNSARERRVIDPENTILSTKRLLGRPFRNTEVRRAEARFAFKLVEGPTGGIAVETRAGTFSLPEISALILRLLRETAERALGAPCRDAVVTVPANFNELQRTATRNAARIAGLNVVRILNEPTAAALAYGFGKGKHERVAVYDLGGGTFDISVLDLSDDVFEVAATAGDSFLGGDDIDVAVAAAMAGSFLEKHEIDLRRDPLAHERLLSAAEQLKWELSDRGIAKVRIQEVAFDGRGRPLDLEYELVRAGLDHISAPLVKKTFIICDEAMSIAGLHPTQLDGIILVGGSTRAPLVRQMVGEYFGREPLASIDPDQVVAQGAALQGYSLAKAQEEIRRATRGAAPPPAAKPPPASPGRPAAEAPGLPPARAPSAEPVASAPAATPTEPAPADAAAAFSVAPSDEKASETSGEVPAVPDASAPLLLDVTPHTLGVETVGGFCEEVIARNSPIPTEQKRLFTTSQDHQQNVRVRIYQGEEKRIEQNQELGIIEMDGLRKALRGHVKIGVTFILDADGTLGVTAQDLATGKAQRIDVRLLGDLDEDEIERMRERHARIQTGVE